MTALSPDLETPTDMTIEKCSEMAATSGMAYFGLQNAYECWGSNDLTHATGLGAGTCVMNCRGDASQVCGDANTNSIYATPGERVVCIEQEPTAHT